MKLFKSFTMKWWEVGLFKLMLISLGILVGATWPEIFAPLRLVFLATFVLPALYICWIWAKQPPAA